MNTVVHLLEGSPVSFPGRLKYRIDRWGHLALAETPPQGQSQEGIRAVFPAHRWVWVEWVN